MDPAEFRADNPYASFGDLAIAAPADQRLAFIRKTYMHLAAAIYAFVAIEYALFQTSLPATMLDMLGQSRFSWLIVMGGFVAVSWIADNWARTSTSIGKQYAGLFLYVLAEAVVFLPLLAIAKSMSLEIQGFGERGHHPRGGHHDIDYVWRTHRDCLSDQTRFFIHERRFGDLRFGRNGPDRGQHRVRFQSRRVV
jgi:hypothetical protein